MRFEHWSGTPGLPLRVLIACESSGAVRRAFRALGHHAWSCDLQPADDGSPFHIQGDALEAAQSFEFGGTPWDLMIAHPPCTHLAVSGARWFPAKRADGRQRRALQFVRDLMAAPIPCIAIENPVSIISTAIRPSDQTIQPHQFGDPAFKATSLWLKGLPRLVPTAPLTLPPRGTDEWKRWNAIHLAPPSPDRWKVRSKTFEGIARAMADQWSVAALAVRDGALLEAA